MAGDQRIVARDGETEDIIILNVRHFVFLFFPSFLTHRARVHQRVRAVYWEDGYLVSIGSSFGSSRSARRRPIVEQRVSISSLGMLIHGLNYTLIMNQSRQRFVCFPAIPFSIRLHTRLYSLD